jgi:hypothetical protein
VLKGTVEGLIGRIGQNNELHVLVGIRIDQDFIGIAEIFIGAGHQGPFIFPDHANQILQSLFFDKNSFLGGASIGGMEFCVKKKNSTIYATGGLVYGRKTCK